MEKVVDERYGVDNAKTQHRPAAPDDRTVAFGLTAI